MSTNPDEILICRNPECRVTDTKKCVDGFELQKCPNFGRAAEAADAATAETATQAVPSISLPQAELLSTSDAARIVRANDTQLVAVVGPNEAGKTSLIASLYDLFQQNPLGQIEFRRSSTLFAFERACHHSRAVSRRSAPFHERTQFGGFGFYHLGVRDVSSGRSLDLLLADRTGEQYRPVADNPSVAAELVEVKRADVITVLVDGARLLDPTSRHGVRSDIQMILQGLVDGDAISGQPLAIVLTKFDEIKLSPLADRAQRDFEGFVDQIKRLFSAYFSNIESFRISASPRTDILTRGYGIPELLHFWINTHKPVPRVERPQTSSIRAMSRFTETNA